MRTLIRRTTLLAVLGALAVGSGLPAVAQSGQPASLTQRQSILTELSTAGEPGTSRVFTQLTATGSGPVTVALPDQSTSGLRSLDGFGAPDVDGDAVIWTLDAEDEASARSVADNTAELPVSLSVAYTLDGEPVDPSDLAGADGRVGVEYTVRNLTAEPRDIVSFDAENNRVIETMDVAVPMVGTLSLTLPPGFANIDAPGAVTAGDGRGNTVVNFSLLLFAPLGAEEQVVSWSADAFDTAIPETSLQVLPVDDRSFGSLSSTAAAYKDASGSLTDLANGALIINSNLQLLGAGASQLLDGLNQLAEGAGELSDGLANTAAPGARTLSDGLSQARAGGGELATGLGTLALGATRLSGGLGDARTGAGQLSGGLPQLVDGIVTVRDGIAGLQGGVGGTRNGAAEGTLIGGLNALRAGIAGLPDSVQAGIAENLDATLQGVVLPSLRTNLQNGLQAALGDNLATGAGDPLEDALRDALQQQFGPGLVAELEPQLAAALVAALKGQVTPGVVAALGPGLDDAVTAALQGQVTPGLTAGLEAALADALQAAPVNMPEPNAVGFADAFFTGATPTVNGAFTTFGDSFGPGFASGFAPNLDGAFDAFGPAFAGGFADALPASLNAGFATFAEAFAPQFAQAFGPGFAAVFAPAFATGFAAQVSPRFEQLADQFAAGFADGVGDSLGEQALPGFDQLLAGLSNEGCDRDDPREPTNPCGVRQVLALLRGGTGELASGAGTAAGGAGQLAAGLVQLDDGAGELAAGADRAASGSRDLASGLVQLDDGAARLADGLGDAADGSTRLADGLRSAEDGGQQLADGTVALSEGLEDQLIAGVSSARQGASQDHEQVRAVIARGREGAAPYGVADGAEATTVFQFDLAGVGTEEGPSTPLLVVLAVVALAVAGGLGIALQRRLAA